MKEETHRILTQAKLQPQAQSQEPGLGTQIRTLFSGIDTDDLPITPRHLARRTEDAQIVTTTLAVELQSSRSF